MSNQRNTPAGDERKPPEPEVEDLDLSAAEADEVRGGNVPLNRLLATLAEIQKNRQEQEQKIVRNLRA